MRYSVLDPTGNITALVESSVSVGEQPSAAAAIMRSHPEVEQVGFVRYFPEEDAPIRLRMAGGEFCGNATMSAAALFAMREQDTPQEVLVSVSGASDPLQVRLSKAGTNTYDASVRMPNAERIAREAIEGCLPVVFLGGISHVIIEEDSPFFSLLANKTDAERAVRTWCKHLNVDGLGLMFLDSHDTLTPLVYVPGSNTVSWEHSCASGSSAVGMYLAEQANSPIAITLHEPGGDLRIQSDGDKTVLHGTVKLVKQREISLLYHRP